MRVLVCGSRDWDDWPTTLFLAQLFRNGDVLIEGGARGADTMMRKAVEALGYDVRVVEYPADWDRYGKAAGHYRNHEMLDKGKPDRVIAFLSKPLEESRGTRNMVMLAKGAGVPVFMVSRP